MPLCWHAVKKPMPRLQTMAVLKILRILSSVSSEIWVPRPSMHFLCQPVCFRLMLRYYKNQKTKAHHKDQVNKSTRCPTFWQINLLAWILPLSAIGRTWPPQWCIGKGQRKNIIIRGLAVETYNFYKTCCQFVKPIYP